MTVAVTVVSPVAGLVASVAGLLASVAGLVASVVGLVVSVDVVVSSAAFKISSKKLLEFSKIFVAEVASIGPGALTAAAVALSRSFFLYFFISSLGFFDYPLDKVKSLGYDAANIFPTPNNAEFIFVSSILNLPSVSACYFYDYSKSFAYSSASLISLIDSVADVKNEK